MAGFGEVRKALRGTRGTQGGGQRQWPGMWTPVKKLDAVRPGGIGIGARHRTGIRNPGAVVGTGAGGRPPRHEGGTHPERRRGARASCSLRPQLRPGVEWRGRCGAGPAQRLRSTRPRARAGGRSGPPERGLASAGRGLRGRQSRRAPGWGWRVGACGPEQPR